MEQVDMQIDTALLGQVVDHFRECVRSDPHPDKSSADGAPSPQETLERLVDLQQRGAIETAEDRKLYVDFVEASREHLPDYG